MAELAHIWTSFLISLPAFIPVVIATRDFQGHQSSPPRFGPELAAALEPALELPAQGFHGPAADRTAFRRPRLVMNRRAMMLKVIGFFGHQRGPRLLPLRTPGGQVLQGWPPGRFAAVPLLVPARFAPRLRPGCVFRIQRVRRFPEVLAGGVKIQPARGGSQAIRHKLPKPHAPVGHHIDARGLAQAAPPRLGRHAPAKTPQPAATAAAGS